MKNSFLYIQVKTKSDVFRIWESTGKRFYNNGFLRADGPLISAKKYCTSLIK